MYTLYVRSLRTADYTFVLVYVENTHIAGVWCDTEYRLAAVEQRTMHAGGSMLCLPDVPVLGWALLTCTKSQGHVMTVSHKDVSDE